MSVEVEVVAVGARTPLGYSAESSAAAVRAGISRYAEFPFIDARGEPVVVASRTRVELAGRGHAGALRAVEQALRECSEGREFFFLVAGVDSYHHAETFLWLERSRRFAQPGVRGGFTPGEGAGCLALMSAGLRRRLRLPRLAVVRGVCTARERQLRDSDTGSFGIGMTQAVEGAVEGLDLPREGIDDLYTDVNGERYRSEEWGFVALRTPSVWKSPWYRAPSDCWGDVGAASGALGGVLAGPGLCTQLCARPPGHGAGGF